MTRGTAWDVLKGSNVGKRTGLRQPLKRAQAQAGGEFCALEARNAGTPSGLMLRPRHERMVTGRTLLEDGRVFKSPGLGRDFPSRMRLHHLSCGGKIGGVIRPKIEPSPLPRPLSEVGEKLGLHQAVFMMPTFGPRIGKQHKYLGKPQIRRQRGQKILRTGVEEVKIGQSRAIFLPIGALNPLEDDIQAYTGLGRMGGGIIREEVTMSAAYFQNAGLKARQIGSGLRLKGRLAISDLGDVSGGIKRVFHENWSEINVSGSILVRLPCPT